MWISIQIEVGPDGAVVGGRRGQSSVVLGRAGLLLLASLLGSIAILLRQLGLLLLGLIHQRRIELLPLLSFLRQFLPFLFVFVYRYHVYYLYCTLSLIDSHFC